MVLRDLCDADVEPFVQAFLDDPPLREDLGHDDDPTREEVLALVAEEDARRAAGERLRLAMADPASDAFAGDIVLHRFAWAHRRCDVGFFVVPRARRRGVALEALRLLTGWAFRELGLWRIGLQTARGNLATQTLAQRAGFEREGVLRGYSFEGGRHVDIVAFSLLADEVPS